MWKVEENDGRRQKGERGSITVRYSAVTDDIYHDLHIKIYHLCKY